MSQNKPLLPELDWMSELQRDAIIAAAGDLLTGEFSEYLKWCAESPHPDCVAGRVADRRWLRLRKRIERGET